MEQVNIFYQKFYKEAFFPFYETIWMRRKTLFYLEQMSRQQWLPLDQLRAIQWAKFQAIIKHAYENVPFYRNSFNKNSVSPLSIKSPGDVWLLPLLSKEDVQTNLEELQAVNLKHLNVCFNETGGSTGKPINFVFSRDSYERRIAASWRSLQWTGWDIGKKTTLIWGRDYVRPSFLKNFKTNLHNKVQQRQFINAFFLTENNLFQIIESIRKFNPFLIEAYTSALYKIAQHIKESGARAPKPKAIIVSAETLYDFQREMIESVFQCPVFNRYGSSEVMLIGCECKEHKGLHMNIDNLFIEFVDDLGRPVPDGQEGKIVITDLNNFGMPFIRYLIGDIGSASNRVCPCGIGLPLMDSPQGRTADILYAKNGRFIQPQLFCFMLPRFDWIKQYQLYQREKGMLEVRIIRSREVSFNEVQELKTKILEIIQDPIDLDVYFLSELPLTKSGKQKMVISELTGTI